MRRLLICLCTAAALWAAPVSAQDGPASGLVPIPVPAPVPVFGYPPLVVDRDGILGHLEAGRFDELERLFAALEAATSRDIVNEMVLVGSYRVFFGPDRTIEPRLDEWVASNPRSDAALVARAHFSLARSWEARGQSTEIVDSDLQGDALRAGLEDASRALELDPDNLAVYAIAIRLFHPLGWSEPLANALDLGLERFPTSYYLRDRALAAMVPRWGGSFQLMRDFAEESQSYADRNPRLRVLLGAATIHETQMLREAGQYDAALATLEEARQYGTDWDFHFERGHTLYHAGELEAALAPIDSAIAIRPIADGPLTYRGRIWYRTAYGFAPPDRREPLLAQGVSDLIEATRLSHDDPTIATLLAESIALRGQCQVSAVDCVPSRRALNAKRLALLLAMLGALTLCLVNFPEWRRQGYWAPRVVHGAALFLFLLLVLSSVAVGAPPAEWLSRGTVTVVVGVFPYLIYLFFMGPRFVGRSRAPVG